jgi:hypothetical protein
MRPTSMQSVARLSVVPKAETPPPERAHQPVEQEPDPEGTDLSLPKQIESPLALALDEAGFRLERSNTDRLGKDNIHFHRICGMSGSSASYVALLYVDEKRLEAYQEPWFVYSVCIRICRRVTTRKNETLCIAFVAPDDVIRFPDTWKPQGEDLEYFGVVKAVNFHRVGSPAKWTSAGSQTAMQYFRGWVWNVDLRPVDAPDAFDRRRERHSFDTSQPNNADSTDAPLVFISYAHDDTELLNTLRTKIRRLENKYCRVFTDKCTIPGEDWFKNIRTNLESCQIAMLLVSESFLASDFIRNEELNRLLETAEERKKTILWVYASKIRDFKKRNLRYQQFHDITEPLDRILRYQAAHDILEPLDLQTVERQDDQLEKVCGALATYLSKLPQNQ